MAFGFRKSIGVPPGLRLTLGAIMVVVILATIADISRAQPVTAEASRAACAIETNITRWVQCDNRAMLMEAKEK